MNVKYKQIVDNIINTEGVGIFNVEGIPGDGRGSGDFDFEVNDTVICLYCNGYDDEDDECECDEDDECECEEFDDFGSPWYSMTIIGTLEDVTEYVDDISYGNTERVNIDRDDHSSIMADYMPDINIHLETMTDD